MTDGVFMDPKSPDEPTAEVTPLPVPATAPADPERWTHDHRPSIRSRALSQALYLGLRPFIHRVPGHAAGLRAARSTVDAASLLMRAGQRARVLPLVDPRVETGTDAPPVVGEWVVSRSPAGASTSRGAILYLHGGGYVVCSPRTHRPITSRLAVETGLPVLAPHYRMAPEHPFPAPLEDALAAYRWLLDRGVPASGIVLAGDSAGGHLAASLTGEIMRTGLPRPAGTVLFSPWVDLTCELSTQEQRVARDPYISAYAARRLARVVVGPTGFDDPRLALLACPWADAPPFLVQVGGAEVLRPEAEALADVLDRADVDCELQVWTGQMHVFQILNRVLPEASAAMSEAARFVTRVTRTEPVAASAVA
ncbi:alpha/beta hydrolase [Actinomadura rupiterrae]|uniref:alpha/beta hydrolase n=1 Tax=Actinomadura rupiterrae TaxID=559627 RepID=UPI0020A38B4C|nr:alpha/beta hydrolase [Actinomadura rupiterrae]MCP2343499.1 acetyl esterase/lipase [Actinomadura rupiterrae]